MGNLRKFKRSNKSNKISSDEMKLVDEIARNVLERETLAFRQLDEKVPIDRSVLRLITMLKAVEDACNISDSKGEEVRAQYFPEIRKIGEEAYKDFGDDYMLSLGQKVRNASMYGGLLNIFWDGIGKWRA